MIDKFGRIDAFKRRQILIALDLHDVSACLRRQGCGDVFRDNASAPHRDHFARVYWLNGEHALPGFVAG